MTLYQSSRGLVDSRNLPKSKYELEQEMLQAEINRIKTEEARSVAAGQQSAQLAAKFFDQWNTSLAETKGVFNQAIAASNQSMGIINKAYGDVGKIDDIVAQLGTEFDNFSQQYGGLEESAIAGAQEGIEAERALTSRIMGYSEEDQGVDDRAMADVGSAAEKENRAEAMRMQSLGIDPTSGRFSGTMRRNRTDTAISKALAGNKARLDEKMRAGNYSIAGMNAIDPSRSAGIATNIAAGKQNLLSQKTGAAQTALQSRSDLATAAGNVSSNLTNAGTAYSRAVTEPQGEMFAANLGTAIQNAPVATKKAPTASPIPAFYGG